MPPARPGTLGDATYAQLLAFLLQENGSQPGARELPADEKAAVTEAVNALMGSKPEARFRFIQEHAAFAKDLDI